jgi:hypothetical protein
MKTLKLLTTPFVQDIPALSLYRPEQQDERRKEESPRAGF